MEKTFNELFDDFFKKNNINPDDKMDGEIQDEVKKIINVLNNFNQIPNISEEEEASFDETLGRPDKIEFYNDGNLLVGGDGKTYTRTNLINNISPLTSTGLSDDAKTALGITGFYYYGNGWWSRFYQPNNTKGNSISNGNAIDFNFNTWSNLYIDAIDDNRFNQVSNTLKLSLGPIDDIGNGLYMCFSIDVDEFIFDDENPSDPFNAWKFTNLSALVGVLPRNPKYGADQYTVPVNIEPTYNRLYSSPIISECFMDCQYPATKNYTKTDEFWRWDSRDAGILLPIVNGAFLSGLTINISDLFSGNDDDLRNGVDLYFCLSIKAEGDNKIIKKASFNVKNIDIIKNIDVGNGLGVGWSGRELDGSVITTTAKAYNLTCRNQNLDDLNIQPPSTGWGTQEPTVADWNVYLNQSFSYGGINSIAYELKGEVTDARKFKNDLAVMMVGLGAVGDDGREWLYSLVDGLYNDDGLLIEDGDLFEGSAPNKKSIDQSEIFNEYTVNGVSILNVDASTQPTTNSDLWQMGRALYNAYKVKNSYKKDNLLTESGTLEFIKSMMMWFGVNDEFRDDPSIPIVNWVVYDRFTIMLELPIEFAINNSIYVGAKIRYNDYWDGLYSGIVTDRVYSPTRKTISITASCTSNTIVSGGDSIIVIETGSATDRIIETGSNTDIIVEGE